MTSLFFTVEEVAERLHLHVKTVRRYIRDGRLKGRRIGKEYRVTRTDLEAFAGVGTQPAAESPLRTREVTVSTVVDVDAISPKDSDRITTMLVASLNARRGEPDFPRLDSLYYPERGRLRITIVASPELTSDLLRTIDMLLESTRS
jgi:excisionase family DNA binding protein